MQCSSSSSQPPCELVNIGSSLGYIGLWHQCRVVLTLSSLTQIFCFTLLWQPQMLPFFLNQVPQQRGAFLRCGNLSPVSAPPPRGAGLVLLSLFFLLPSVFHSTYLSLDPYNPFQWPRSSGIAQTVFWENCSICGCTSDSSMEGDALHVPPLLHHIGTLRNIFPYSQILL